MMKALKELHGVYRIGDVALRTSASIRALALLTAVMLVQTSAQSVGLYEVTDIGSTPAVA